VVQIGVQKSDFKEHEIASPQTVLRQQDEEDFTVTFELLRSARQTTGSGCLNTVKGL